MDATKLTNNEVVMETVEEVIERVPKKVNNKTALIVVGSMIVGGLVCRFVVEPVGTKIGNWIGKKKTNKADDDNLDDDFEDDDFEDEN